MKVLILTMSSGEGHNSFARAISEECRNRGHEEEVWDIFSYDKLTHAFNEKGFVLLMKYFRKPYSLVWEYQIKRDPDKWTTGIFVNSLKKLKKRILEKLAECKPDVVICTHYYAADAMSLLVHEGKTSVPFHFVLTDYYTYPNVEVARMATRIFVPTSHAVEGVLAQGYRSEQVVVTDGLPVKRGFERCVDKPAMRAKLGLADRFTVLVFAGSSGEIPVSKVLKSLEADGPADMNVVFIAGRNKSERKKIERKVKKGLLTKVRVEGFVSNMNEFLAAADLVICKSSGGALAECAKVGVPVVIREKMIINEKRNQQVFMSADAAVSLDGARCAGKIVSDLASSKDKLRRLAEKISAFSSDRAICNIVDRVEADFAEINGESR